MNHAPLGRLVSDSNNKSEVQMRSDFMIGKSGVFIAYPNMVEI